jgi:sugar lactone lactonase YvrE
MAARALSKHAAYPTANSSSGFVPRPPPSISLGTGKVSSSWPSVLSPVAEVHGSRLTAYDIGQEGDLANRRMWATAGDDHPDGICIDAERAVWYADVGNRHCVRVREGGEILATVDLDRGAFACTLSRDDKPQLYVVGQQFGGPEATEPTGQVVVFPASAPGAGKP